MSEEKEKCDLCDNPNSTDPAMNLCWEHLEEATKPDHLKLVKSEQENLH